MVAASARDGGKKCNAPCKSQEARYRWWPWCLWRSWSQYRKLRWPVEREKPQLSLGSQIGLNSSQLILHLSSTITYKDVWMSKRVGMIATEWSVSCCVCCNWRVLALDCVWWKLSFPAVILGSLKTVATLTPESRQSSKEKIRKMTKETDCDLLKIMRVVMFTVLHDVCNHPMFIWLRTKRKLVFTSEDIQSYTNLLGRLRGTSCRPQWRSSQWWTRQSSSISCWPWVWGWSRSLKQISLCSPASPKLSV